MRRLMGYDEMGVAVHALAQEIEEVTAMRLADLARSLKRRCLRSDFYDPHAATELANLIMNRMTQ